MLQMEGISPTTNHAPAAAAATAAAGGGKDDDDVFLSRCARRRRLRLRRMLNQDGRVDEAAPSFLRNGITVPEEPQKGKGKEECMSDINNSSKGPDTSSRSSSAILSVCSGAYQYGSVCLIGKRREMEDAVTVAPGFAPGHDFFGVYDGHGGREVADACKERMHVVLAGEVQNKKNTFPVEEEQHHNHNNNRENEEDDRYHSTSADAGDWREAMEACFLKMDGEVVGSALASGSALQKTVGSTAVVAVVGPRRIVVANCGDSRAVLCRAGVAVPLSRDHKPDRPDELERVEALGGRVIDWDGFRVLGVLATSRSIGDQYLKPFVIPEPEVTVTERTDRDEFLILASDGLWDVVSSERACALVRMCVDGRLAGVVFPTMGTSTTTAAAKGCGDQAAFAATALAELAMCRGSRDNISVVVVVL